jgi:hypothetical protein
MDTCVSLLSAFGLGAVLGAFIAPRIVAKFAAAIAGTAIAGLALSFAFSLASFVILFGLASILLSVGALLVWLGAWFSASIRKAVRGPSPNELPVQI